MAFSPWQRRLALTAVAFVLGSAILSSAAERTIVLTATDDTRLEQKAPTSNYGSSTTLYVTSNACTSPEACGKWAEPLIQFDLSALAGARVTAARLRVYVTVMTTPAARFDVFRIRSGRPWTQATATWNQYTTSSPWTIPGAKSTITDRRAVAMGTLTGVATTGWKEVTLGLSGIQDWIDNPLNNRGLILVPAAGAGNDVGFASRETGKGPQLYLEYTIADDEDPTPVFFKIAALNLHDARGFAGSAGNCTAEGTTFAAFSATACTVSNHLTVRNGWTSGFVPAALREDYASDPELVAFVFSDQGPRTSADTNCGDADDVLRELGWTSGETTWGSQGDPLRRSIVAKYGFANGPVSAGEGGPVVRNAFVGMQTDTFSGTEKPQYITRAPVWVNAERSLWVYLYVMYMHGGFYTPDITSDIHADIRESLMLIGAHVANPPDGVAGTPSIVGGDFNFTTDGWDAQCANRVTDAPVFLGMTDTWRFVHPADDPQYEGFTKGCGAGGIAPRYKRIDYIFSNGLTIDSSAIVDRSGCDISDHKGVVTRFRLSPRPAPN